MWATKWFVSLIQDLCLHEVKFQQCMHGGRRDKWTSLYVNHAYFDHMAVECDQQHDHLPWGVAISSKGHRFNTAEEAEYPQLMCSRISEAIHKAAQALGAQNVSAVSSKRRKAIPLAMAQAGKQPRGNRFPEVLPEFREVCELSFTLPRTKPVPRKLQSHECDLLGVQGGAKLLTCVQAGSVSDVSKNADETPRSCKVGIYRTPDEFVEAALRLSHPFDGSSYVDDAVKRNIFELYTLGAKGVKDKRLQAFAYYKRRQLELQSRENALHAMLEPARANIVKDKRFLLFSEMAKDAGVVDDSLLEDLLAGFSLIGQSGCSSLFLEEDTLPAMSREQLMKSSRWSRKMVAAKGMDSHAEGLNVVEETWATTMDEVQRGWLQGPFSQDEIRQRLGPLFVASPRFGLMQGEKCRPIDDMSISLVNAAFAAAYKLDLDGVDGISVMARTMIEAVADDGTVELELSDGSVMKGYLHPSFSVASARQLAGRTLDLEAAYKQLLVRESSLWCSALQVRRPSGSNAYFISQVLPFGASASVYAFNRVSRALHCVGTRLFSLVWSNYYDDFPQLDVAMAGEDATTTAEGLMDLLGWRYSKKENKRLPMSLSFSALGVVFDFQAAQEGKVIVRNKESRAEQIYEEITKILQLGTFTRAQAASLRGKLQFAESQTFSRAVALHMRERHARANQAGPSQPWDSVGTGMG